MDEQKNTASPSLPEEKVKRVRSPRRDKSEKGERGRRWVFLAVDILLLAAIVASVMFLVSLLTPISFFGSDQKEVRAVSYTVELAGVEKGAIEALHIGDTVVDKESGNVLGVVTAVASRAYETYTDVPSAAADPTLGSHVVQKKTYPDDFLTVTVTLSTDATYESGVGYRAGDTRIAVGRAFSLQFPAFVGDGVCVTLTTP